MFEVETREAECWRLAELAVHNAAALPHNAAYGNRDRIYPGSTANLFIECAHFRLTVILQSASQQSHRGFSGGLSYVRILLGISRTRPHAQL